MISLTLSYSSRFFLLLTLSPLLHRVTFIKPQAVEVFGATTDDYYDEMPKDLYPLYLRQRSLPASHPADRCGRECRHARAAVVRA